MRFYGQFNPPVDKILYENYFKNKRNGFFIECGAYNGLLDSSCKFFEEFMEWKGINVEASPRIFMNLMKNRPKSSNINVALSDEKGKSIFRDIVTSGVADGNGSLQHHPKHIQILKNQGCGFKNVMVETITFLDLIKIYNIIEVDLFVLDVEGCEIKVLNKMNGIMPKVCCIEYSFSGLENIEKLMKNLNYKLDFTNEVNAFLY